MFVILDSGSNLRVTGFPTYGWRSLGSRLKVEDCLSPISSALQDQEYMSRRLPLTKKLKVKKFENGSVSSTRFTSTRSRFNIEFKI